MTHNSNVIGLHKSELDTPALLVDLAVMERNIERMSAYVANTDVKLRPHVKLHKATPALAHRQLAAPHVIGLTCARLSEAEILGASGIKDILIANQIVGERNIRRLVNLAAYTNVMVAVDNPVNVTELSKWAAARGISLRVLIEVNVGNNRAGVEPFNQAVALAKNIISSPGLCFAGLMGYDGHSSFPDDAAERKSLSSAANNMLLQSRKFFEEQGINVEIVSAAGTLTFTYASAFTGITEVQTGTYLLMDSYFKEKQALDFEMALTVLGTVISRPTWPGAEDLAIIDVGRKSMDQYYGLPVVKSPSDAVCFNMPQEHGRLRLSGNARDLKIGDRVELWVHDANGTINLHDRFYAIRDDLVEAVWDIPRI